MGSCKEKIIKDYSIGIICFYTGDRKIKYLLIKHSKGHWAFPKGHREKEETKLETAKRELLEETGIKKIKLIEKKIQIIDSYKFLNSTGGKTLKTVYYFIGECDTKKVNIDNKEVIKYKWCTLNKSLGIITFSQQKKVITKANKIILKLKM
jgi:tRNA nucleotidyltransferase (CCA-adding enzyme)